MGTEFIRYIRLLVHYKINKDHFKWVSYQSSHISYMAITCLYYDRAVRCILLLVKGVIFNASFEQAETEGLHILWEVIPDLWALIAESALPGTCCTV